MIDNHFDKEDGGRVSMFGVKIELLDLILTSSSFTIDVVSRCKFFFNLVFFHQRSSDQIDLRGSVGSDPQLFKIIAVDDES